MLTSRNFSGVKIEVLGDLNTINKFVRLGGEIGAAVKTAHRRFMEKYMQALKYNFYTGGSEINIILDAESTTRRKRAQGYFLETGMMTGELVDSIELRVYGKTASVGVKPGAMGKGELEVAEYGAILEHGGPKQPPRPFFRNTYKITMGGNAGLAKFMRNSLNQTIIRQFKHK